ncbi:hypothetical protein JTB14_008433 [Gonioctena quinquepunctata]|nr:hypothetical protein JTB14_008433 [Gonioctena quinquepunctata]
MPYSSCLFKKNNEDFKAKQVLIEAENQSRDDGLLPENVKISFKSYDDGCKQDKVSGAMIYAIRDDCVHVIFGSTCEYCSATVGRTAKYIYTPVLTPAGLSYDFTKRKQNNSDEFYFLLNTGIADFRSFSEFYHLILHRYGWNRMMLMYERNDQVEIGGEGTCHLCMSNLVAYELKDISPDYMDGDLSLLGNNYTEFLISKVGVDYGIILTCASQSNIRKIAIEAAKLMMADGGEYTFFSFELYNSAAIPSRPWYSLNDTHENNELARKGYESTYTFMPLSETKFNSVKNQKIRGSIWLDGMYDGMMMLTQSLDHLLWNDSISFENKNFPGCKMFHGMMGKSFRGKNGKMFQMDCNGIRARKIALLSIDSDGDYEIMGIYSTLNQTIDFWNMRWNYGVPSDIPKCGYDKSKCPTYDVVKILVISLISVILLGLSIVGIIIYRQIKLKSEIEARAWKVDYKDILFMPKKTRMSFQSMASMKTEVDGMSIAGRQLYANVGSYKSRTVAVKYLKDTRIELTHENLYELKIMKDLSHDNLVKFYGASLDIPNCLLTEYCQRGSLDDILGNDQVKLDWSIRISLIMDLVRGMYYLHRSPIKSHGALKSSNCLVDSRFALKIADFGLSFLRAYVIEESSDKESFSFWRKLLWTAPELLNMHPIPPAGSQKGDVYSFGIIMHEIIVRQGVFFLGHHYMNVKEILDKVKEGPGADDGQPLRPYVGDNTIYEVEQLMIRCWAEDSVDRPDFSTIKNKLHQFNKKESEGNLVDNLLARMEQYATNLETLVEERTSDYLEEKRKCEELLYQLLPRSVAQQLITGESVIAETFESVTIYFSDIVGFTEISALSTPLQVVDLLNDLYTCFDSIIEAFDVYKVETIGDAYMVVSGLPERNGNEHAGEIAKMSLALLEAVNKFKIRHMSNEPLKLRIGIHSGPCVAGVVGLKMPRFCLFGDTVNTASRMESNGLPLRIHVSPYTKEILDTLGTFEVERRGEIEIKGKGPMTTYWLINELNPTKATKSPPPIIEIEPSVRFVSFTCTNVQAELANDVKAPNSMKTSHNSDEAGIPLLSHSSESRV